MSKAEHNREWTPSQPAQQFRYRVWRNLALAEARAFQHVMASQRCQPDLPSLCTEEPVDVPALARGEG